MLEAEDILFARSGATVGKTYIHSKEIGKAIFAGYCIRFRFDKSKVLPWFIYFYTKTGRYQLWVKSMQRAAGQPNINKEEFKSFTIPVPSLNVQEKLVAKMQAARENRKQKLAQSDELLAGIDKFLLNQFGLNQLSYKSKKCFAILFKQIDGPINPDRYSAIGMESNIEGVPIEKVGNILENKISPSRKDKKGEWDWIRIDDLSNESLKIDKIRTESGSNLQGTFFTVEKNDILIARLGPTILNRKFILCPKIKEKTIASPEFLVLRCYKNWNPLFVLWVLKTSFYRDLIYSKCRGGTPSRYRISREDLGALPFPDIDKKKQDELANMIKEKLDIVQHFREEAERDWQRAKVDFEAQLLGKGVAL